MAEEKKTNMAGEEAQQAVAPATDAPQSQRDRYRQRVNADQYGDDEESYYKEANGRLDELEALNKGVSNMRSVMDKSPMFARMIAEAKNNENFNPVTYLIENGQLDIEALNSDPEYSQKIADAQNAWLEKQSKAEEADRLLGENLSKEIEGCIEDGMAQGMTREEALEQVGKTFEWLDKLDKGEIRELNAIMLKGMNHDTDVENATKQGEANGRATKVRDTLKSMPTMSARSGGSQMRGAERVPEQAKQNMFGI